MEQTPHNCLRIQHVDVGKLTPWARNPRVNEQAVNPVAKSIRQLGFNVPIPESERAYARGKRLHPHEEGQF